jgi:CubicO group peptidase (beta-lactamase class C family)
LVATANGLPTSAHRALEATPWDRIERLFRTQLSPLRLFPGAALAVYHRGRLVLDLTDGYADTQRGELVQRNSLFPLYSGTKPFASVAIWQQIERGSLSLEEPVAAAWPAFGQAGKDRVLIRHILSHRGGFPTTPPTLPPHRWEDWEAVMQAIAAMPVEFEPGTVSAYHFLTQQWVCAELVRRRDGRAYGEYLRAEICEPLDLRHTHVGLSGDLEPLIVKLHATDGTDAWGRDTLQAMYRTAAPNGGSRRQWSVDRP